ncbi:MAG: LPS assembly lipoprotein LptE [Gemmatimonadaceae bacterium]
MTLSGADRNRRARRALLRRAVRGSVLLVPLVLAGCLYGFSGGGGLPRNLRTVAVQPFDNQTASAEIQREVLDETRNGMRDKLNLREAPEARADVLVRGTIVRYEVDLQAGVSADPRQTTSTRRRLQLVIDIEILEQATGRTLFKKQALQTEGQYPEGGEATGRKYAIESYITQVIEGMQSQW